MLQNNIIDVEVAFATVEKQTIIVVVANHNSSIYDVIIQSKIHEEFSCFDFTDITKLHIGIFGKKIDPTSYTLKHNDRIEIYRTLNKTPNQKRLERAKLNDKA
ncbi:MAG: RnfH family protein [Burkholderiales bacterium]|nr:RnfH family protein [Burkholderiales bacterium]